MIRKRAREIALSLQDRLDHPPAPRLVSHEPSTIDREGVSSTLPQNIVEAKPEAVLETWGSGNTPVGIGNQEPLADEEPSLIGMDESWARENQIVVVKRGDNLTRIIFRAYGRYDGAMLRAVLRENPEIQNANRLMPGQVIKLPKET